jgi:hypothetical protein
VHPKKFYEQSVLKGQCHEIYHFWFFPRAPGPYRRVQKLFQIVFFEYLLSYLIIKVLRSVADTSEAHGNTLVRSFFLCRMEAIRL